MTDPKEEINELRRKNEELEKKLSDINELPNMDQLNGLLEGFKTTTIPGMEGIDKVVKGLEKTAKSFEGMQSLLSKMTKEDVEKIMKRDK